MVVNMSPAEAGSSPSRRYLGMPTTRFRHPAVLSGSLAEKN
jgi:hypothetical protein